MKTKQLLIGGAVLAVGLYLYSKNKKSPTNIAEDSTEAKPTSETSSQETPSKGATKDKIISIKEGKSIKIKAPKGTTTSKKSLSQLEEDALMDSVYEEAKSKTVKVEGVLGKNKYKRDVAALMYTMVKIQIPDRRKFKAAFIRLQMRNPLDILSTSTTDENASFAFNGHTF
jgi:preprotein translocase subunit SecF